MCENQLQYIEENDIFDPLWGTEQFESGLLYIPKVYPSPTVSPWLDEPDCSTPTCTPVATVSNKLENFTPPLCIASKKSKS